MSEYEKQADDFLAKYGITFSQVFIGNDCPTFCEDARKGIAMDQVTVFPRHTHIHGKHYRITLTREGKAPYILDFWNSYADEEQNYAVALWPRKISSWQMDSMSRDRLFLAKKYSGMKPVRPKPYDVLACVTDSDPGSFGDFCGDFGMDDDSIRALNTYHAVVKDWSEVRRFFKPEEMEELQAIS